MALFGLFKQAGETLVADVKEWMGTDYFAAAMAAGVGLFIEETTNAFMQAKLNLTDWKLTAYKTLHRLAFSALYYFGFKNMDKPLLGLTASIMPVAMIFIDAISSLFKVSSPQEAGLRLAERFTRVARASASAGLASSLASYLSPATTASTASGPVVITVGGEQTVGDLFRV